VFELPPLFLALAFILVGLAAYFLGRRNGAARTVRLPRDYYVGLEAPGERPGVGLDRELRQG